MEVQLNFYKIIGWNSMKLVILSLLYEDAHNFLSSFSQVIQVEFEGRNPMKSDFHGVRQLLQQLFLKSDINLSELADTVTGKSNRVFRVDSN